MLGSPCSPEEVGIEGIDRTNFSMDSCIYLRAIFCECIIMYLYCDLFRDNKVPSFPPIQLSPAFSRYFLTVLPSNQIQPGVNARHCP